MIMHLLIPNQHRYWADIMFIYFNRIDSVTDLIKKLKDFKKGKTFGRCQIEYCQNRSTMYYIYLYIKI